MDRRGLLKAAATGLALAAPLLARGAEPLTLRLGHFVPEEHPADIAARRFAARVEARTGGDVRVEIFPNNQLGGPPEQARQISLGILDMGLPTQGQLDKYERAFGAVELPFIFDRPELAFKVLDGPVTDWLAPLARARGFILLRNWDYGFRNLTNSVRPINVPDDVRGLRIRTPPEAQIQASLEALGATVQTIAFAELYAALSRKEVDGQENPISVIWYNKYFETQRHLAITRHLYSNMIHVISPRAWNKLSPDQRGIFREESGAAGDLMRKLIADGEADDIELLAAAGMEVTTPDLAPFRALMEPAYARIADYSGADNVDKFRAMVEQARGG